MFRNYKRCKYLLTVIFFSHDNDRIINTFCFLDAILNFGKFYPQTHKGHRVQFAKQDGDAEVNDYTVLKFSATREVNRRVKVND